MFALERSPLGSFAIMFANRLERPLAYEVGGAERLAFGREYWWLRLAIYAGSTRCIVE